MLSELRDIDTRYSYQKVFIKPVLRHLNSKNSKCPARGIFSINSYTPKAFPARVRVQPLPQPRTTTVEYTLTVSINHIDHIILRSSFLRRRGYSSLQQDKYSASDQ